MRRTRSIFRIRHAGLLAVGLMLLLAACDLFSSEPEEGVTNGLPPPVLHEFPRWSPDGTALLYYDTGLVSYNPDTQEAVHDIERRGIWVMNLATGQRRKLLSAGYADWSPDGSAIVFEAGQIYTARLAGQVVDSASVTQLTSEGSNFYPTWSPDGEWIAYDSNASDPSAPYHVWKMRSDGSEKQDITGFSSREPAWSPDGQHIVHKWYEVEGGEVAVMDAAGDNVQRFTFNTFDDDWPEFSPDGTRIAFQSDWQVWVMEAGGNHKEQLTFDQGGMPDWSPDGQQIVYIGPQNTIWVMDADGANKKQLTFRPDYASSTE